MKKSLLTSILMSFMLMIAGICKADIVQKIAGDYKGSITIDLGEGAGDPIPDQKVSIVMEDDLDLSTICFTLYNFNFPPVIKNENIVLDGVPVEEAIDGTFTIGDNTYSKDLALGGGAVQASVKFDSENSYIDDDNILVILDIMWQGINFEVNFEGKKVASGITLTEQDSFLVTFDYATNLLKASDLQNSVFNVYNVNGSLVKSGNFVNGVASVDELSSGVYIVKTGVSTVKIVKK